MRCSNINPTTTSINATYLIPLTILPCRSKKRAVTYWTQLGFQQIQQTA